MRCPRGQRSASSGLGGRAAGGRRNGSGSPSARHTPVSKHGLTVPHAIFELRVCSSHYPPPPPPASVVAHLAQARSRLALETPCFPSPSMLDRLHPYRQLPPDPPCSRSCHPCCSLCLESFPPLLPISFLGEASLTSSRSPPLYVPSQPHAPPCFALITLHICLCDYVTHASPRRLHTPRGRNQVCFVH